MKTVGKGLFALGLAAIGALCTVQAQAALPRAQAPRFPAVRTLALASNRGAFLGQVQSRSTLTLYIRLQGQHDFELDRLAAAIQTPGSAYYGRYLTPEQFGNYFGASPKAYAEAVSLLRARGFTLDWLAANRTDIVVHAPVSVVSSFFQTPIDYRNERGRIFFTSRFVPAIPPQLHAMAISGLDDYVELHSMLLRNPDAVIHGFFSWAPADIAAAYDLNPLYGKGLNGQGVTIANATCGAATASDLAMFQKQFGLPAATLVSTPVGGSLTTACGRSGPNGNGESSLDVDWATAVARNATFHQVVARTPSNHNFDLAYGYIVNNLGSTVHVVTTSWGQCEFFMKGTASLTIDEKLFAQAITEGQHWFSASGDTGADDCLSSRYPHNSVDYPGSSPYVISVGGTDLRGTKAGGNITAWAGETCWQYKNSDGASGGGQSILYPKPSYQTALTPKDGTRDVPDVSLISDQRNDGVWVAQGGQLQFGWGGDSEAAPQWAGLLAIVEQRYHNGVIADPHARFYQLAATGAYTKLFHDITVGNNGVHDAYGTFPGFSAGPGFDLCSGLGSFIGAALVEAY